MAPNRTSTKVTLAHVRKSNSVSLENSIGGKNCSFAKRKAEHSPARNGISKKPAFNDVENDKSKLGSFKTLKNISENKLRAPVTRAKSVRLSTTRAPLSSIHPNATSDVKLSNSRNSFAKPTKTVSNAGKVREVNKPVTRSSSNLSASVLQPPTTRKALPVKAENSTDVAKVPKQVKSKIEPEPSIVIPKVNVTTNGAEKSEDQENVQPIQNENRPVTRLSARLSLRKSLSAEKSAESSSLYISALEDITNTSARVADKFTLSEFDKELLHDPHQVSLYAMEIFDYLKSREAKFALDDYMVRQRSINENMRAVLVDWMVEVQESFELNHETLYLAVKIVDAYLSKVEIKKEKLQLVGAAALFLSCKYDERLSPLLEDFVYICDNAYTQDHLLAMEQSVLYHIDFELSFPISYSFLRRYARCARIQMPLLTLARFILELALMDYRTVTLSDSKQAAAALYLAFKMVKHDDWTDKHVYYTGYKKSDFKDVVLLFNEILHQKPSEQLKTIRTKYSHELFFKVARTPLISNKDLNLD